MSEDRQDRSKWTLFHMCKNHRQNHSTQKVLLSNKLSSSVLLSHRFEKKAEEIKAVSLQSAMDTVKKVCYETAQIPLLPFSFINSYAIHFLFLVRSQID